MSTREVALKTTAVVEVWYSDASEGWILDLSKYLGSLDFGILRLGPKGMEPPKDFNALIAAMNRADAERVVKDELLKEALSFIEGLEGDDANNGPDCSVQVDDLIGKLREVVPHG